MIGIVIPAHNEALLIGQAVDAVMAAAVHPGLHGEPVEIVVVLDACSDLTGVIAARAGARTVSLRARNVGVARAVGAEAMLAAGARWLAFTDADTVVSPSWLVDQLAQDADAVCGSIGVNDWSAHGVHAEAIEAHFLRTYADVDGHSHIHGANLGVSAAAYRRAGGFRHLACSEDVALVRALEATGARIAWSAKPRVLTSSRRDARARGGFADALLDALAASLAAVAPATATPPVAAT
ncbi:glycosyltransferase [Variovorax saccharolyticus]|uniref:glycosyltransferase n=1 Tax=Variovorax saccharolyticus TaxID=3053516 RepID=UPI0025769700|nr:glycosyltransferase [Variovorax sp. J31P216]MDM0026219.1 glycosyltransferase [Variovorax sp. J31P216]